MKAIENFVDAMLCSFPRTAETEELRESLLAHAQDKFDALLGEGLGEYEALGRVVAEFGSVEELRAGLGLPQDGGPLPAEDDPQLCDLLLEYDLFRSKKRMLTAIAALLIILAPASVPIFSELSFALGPLSFAAFLGAGAGLLSYAYGHVRDCRARIRERRAQLGLPETPPASGSPFPDEQKSRPSRRRLRRMLDASLPIWVVLIYLYLGFAFHLWHPGWFIFFAIPLYYTAVSPYLKD